ncbi:iron complex transport system permease protein [Schumannella luteola]|uniref:Iron complex transport system permease protein n=1 Tax=Schumannella luteola TaxID=472059 RepID=A0A852Y7C7_9MICO|nr:iron complex transport system permease protein [Schumannella luteola]
MTSTRAVEETAEQRLAARRARMRPATVRLLGLLIGIVALAVAIALSLAVGSRGIPLDHVLQALQDLFDGKPPAGTEASVVVESRLPRTAIGIAAGIALGLSGALVQAVTRNPLADPGILGVTYGSGFAIALGIAVLGIQGSGSYVWFALGGALLTTVAVYLIGAGGPGAIDPARLTLAGAALSAILIGVITALSLLDPKTFDVLRAWNAGSLQDRDWPDLLPVLPFLAVGAILALALGGPLNAVALGDDLARSLGANVALVRGLSIAAVTLLAGGATAIAGPIAFVGLMVPHAARFVTGPDQRWILAYTLVLAPVLLLAADVLGRVALYPGELPVGIVTAVLGAPVLIGIARSRRMSSL